MFRRLNELILTVRWPLSLAVAVVTLLTGYLLTTLKIDPSIETLFDKTSLEYRHYSEFTTRYGSDQMIVIAMETEDFFEMAPLKKLRALTRQIEKMESVERVLSLANVMDIKHKFMGVKVVPALKDVWSGDKTPEEIRGDVLANELFRHNLVSADGKIANLIVYLKPARKRTGGAGGVIENLRLILAGYEQQGLTFYMAGAPVEHYEFIRLIRRDQFTFVPLIILILIATILFIYRSLACMVLSMSIVLVTLIWSMGTIALFKQQLNLVTSLLAPVIMIVTIANSIHIMNLFFDVRSQHASLRKSVCITMDQLGVPNFLAHATTVLGFASLAVNPVPAIQSFGIFAAIGTFYSFVVIGLLTPLLLPILPYRPTREHYDESHFFNRFLIRFLEKFEFHWKWLILFVTAVIVAVSVNVRHDSNALPFLSTRRARAGRVSSRGHAGCRARDRRRSHPPAALSPPPHVRGGESAARGGSNGTSDPEPRTRWRSRVP